MLLHHAGPLDEAVRQGGLAVVDMGDDAEVANVGHRKNNQAVPQKIKTNCNILLYLFLVHRPLLDWGAGLKGAGWQTEKF